jgi:hypothetical protein
VTISIDTENMLDKNSIFLHNESHPKKAGKEGSYINITQCTCDKLVVNIFLNGEKLKSFLLKSGLRKGCPLTQLLFS